MIFKKGEKGNRIMEQCQSLVLILAQSVLQVRACVAQAFCKPVEATRARQELSGGKGSNPHAFFFLNMLSFIVSSSFLRKQIANEHSNGKITETRHRLLAMCLFVVPFETAW